MGERRRLGAERLEHLNLRGAVRHMVLAANDMGDAQIDVVDDARQQVEPTAVLTSNHPVAEQLWIEPLLAANEIGPGDWPLVIETEAPMRCAAFGHPRAFGWALIDRRQAAPEQNLAAKLE